MLVLGINTVGGACDIALAANGRLVAELTEPMEQGHDARLAPLADELMRKTGTAFGKLARIAVIVGPGSFTGVRVGVAFARGLSLALDVPSIGVTSLEALDGLPLDGRVLGLLPAKRRPPERTWWAQFVDRGRGEAEPFEVGEDQLPSLAARADAVYGGLADVPDFGRRRIAASPTARAAAVFSWRLADDELSVPRPVYVRAPHAKPMDRP
jgi:tRNA threonylcarbamoyladenosine biosynthesis protein TsaB